MCTEKICSKKIVFPKKLMVAVREGIVRDFGKVMYTLLYLKWITNKDLLYRIWNSAQGYEPAWMGGGLGGEWIHIFVWQSPFPIHLKLPKHF